MKKGRKDIYELIKHVSIVSFWTLKENILFDGKISKFFFCYRVIGDKFFTHQTRVNILVDFVAFLNGPVWDCRLLKMEAQKIKLFQCIRGLCETMGICASEQNQHFSINWKVLLVYLSLVCMFTSSIANLVLIANTALEYSDTILMVATSLSCIVAFTVCLLKMPRILKVLSKLEETIGKSTLEMKRFLQF